MLYQLSYSGILLCVGPTLALLVLLLCLEPFGFASHSRGDPLITNDVLYQLSYSGFLFVPRLSYRPTSLGSTSRFAGFEMGAFGVDWPICREAGRPVRSGQIVGK